MVSGPPRVDSSQLPLSGARSSEGHSASLRPGISGARSAAFAAFQRIAPCRNMPPSDCRACKGHPKYHCRSFSSELQKPAPMEPRGISLKASSCRPSARRSRRRCGSPPEARGRRLAGAGPSGERATQRWPRPWQRHGAPQLKKPFGPHLPDLMENRQRPVAQR